MKAILVWDLPLRLFHWSLLISFMLAWWSADDDAYLRLHLSAGYVLLGLLVFRVLWGFYGSHYARFGQFIKSPKQVWEYLYQLMGATQPAYSGHSPLAGWAILVLLSSLLALSLSGLLVLGGEERQGIFKYWISPASGDVWRLIHAALFQLMQILLILHLLGVGMDMVLQRQNIVKTMFTGYKQQTDNQHIVPAHPLVALGLFAALLSIAMFSYYQDVQLDPLPDNLIWRENCGECHLAYYPTLLPAASWSALMAQPQHFGEELDLENEIHHEIEQFLITHAAESGLNESGWKISQTTIAAKLPLQVTKTNYWRAQHETIEESMWQHPQVISAGNCEACHQDAQQGWFGDVAIFLPSP